ncbi:MAG: hypothetical protein DWQ07_08965 [Chloroflexi bacterium]|nr:MAG: hypothetical protein DWQ07_08965 [Chloroflexota bacterium]MBL1193157.1 hypothetical protein [Chloroflexota bacterium]NOH10450.1 hypothetical protein [Chloroflexota bacterium]
MTMKLPGYLRSRPWLMPFVLVIALAVLMRILFFVGAGFDNNLPVIGDILEITNNLGKDPTLSIQSGLADLRASIGVRKVLLYSPLVLFYALFGFSHTVTVAYSLLSSIIGAISIFCLVAFLIDKKIALAALFIWAINPIEVFSATIFAPNAFVTMLTVFALAIFLFSEREDIRIGMWIGLLILFVVAAIEPFLAGVYILFLVFRFTSQRMPPNKLLAALLILLFSVWLAGSFLGFLPAQANFTFYALLLSQPETLLLFPILVFSVTVPLFRNEKVNHTLIAWLVLAAVAAFVNEQMPGNSVQDRWLYWLHITLPIIFLGAEYFAGSIDKEKVNKGMVISSLLLGFGAWLGLLGQQAFIGPYAGNQLTSLSSIFPIFRMISGLFLIGLFLSPILISRERNVLRSWVPMILVILLGFAFLPMVESRVDDYRYRLISAREIVGSLEKQDLELPLLVESARMEELLNFVAGYDWPKAANEYGLLPSPLKRIPRDLGTIEDAYVLLQEDFLDQEIPGNWVRLGSAGELGKPRWALYRSLTRAEAERVQTDLMYSIDTSLGADTYNSLYEININLGFECEAIEAWINARQFSKEEMTYIPISSELDCLDDMAWIDLVDPQKLRYVYLVVGANFEPAGAGLEDFPYRQISHKHRFFDDPRVVDLKLVLEPNSLYLYEVLVRSDFPTMTLFWDDGASKDYLEMRTYPEWERLAVLLATPAWEGVPTEVRISPVLFDHLGFVDLADWDLWELSVP